MSSKGKKVFVAMSGGVDSSVAALLLKNQDYDVTGVHMLCWEDCQNNQDKQDAMRVAAKLEIPFLVWGFKKEYREAVFNYMVREYAAGRTPNPDVMCNKEIKFGIFLKKALEAGADFIATGHYIRKSEKGGITHPPTPLPYFKGGGQRGRVVSLHSAKDLNKDQSYFLWTLTQGQLKHCLFPIGDYLKSEVREMAKKAGFSTAAKKDSQGLCFVGNVDFGEFIKEALPKKVGAIFSTDGKKIGEHDGAHFYTIGQRHGLNLGGQAQPIFVAQKDAIANTLVVARGQDDPILYKKELIAENFNWIGDPPTGGPEMPFSCQARIRYRQPLQPCRISGDRVIFNQPQRAVAPGQSVVFYAGDEMLGGAIIKE